MRAGLVKVFHPDLVLPVAVAGHRKNGIRVAQHEDDVRQSLVRAYFLQQRHMTIVLSYDLVSVELRNDGRAPRVGRGRVARCFISVAVLHRMFLRRISVSLKLEGMPSPSAIETDALMSTPILTRSTAVTLDRESITPMLLPQPLGPPAITYAVVSSVARISPASCSRGINAAFFELGSSTLELRSTLAALFSIVSSRSCHHFMRLVAVIAKPPRPTTPPAIDVESSETRATMPAAVAVAPVMARRTGRSFCSPAPDPTIDICGTTGHPTARGPVWHVRGLAGPTMAGPTTKAVASGSQSKKLASMPLFSKSRKTT